MVATRMGHNTRKLFAEQTLDARARRLAIKDCAIDAAQVLPFYRAIQLIEQSRMRLAGAQQMNERDERVSNMPPQPLVEQE
jgi:hypothetical protein